MTVLHSMHVNILVISHTFVPRALCMSVEWWVNRFYIILSLATVIVTNGQRILMKGRIAGGFFVSMAVDKRIATVAYVHAVGPVHCCLLAGTAEGSIVFTRLRQLLTQLIHCSLSPHESANCISIGAAIFALTTHRFKPPQEGELLGLHVSVHHPHALIV